MINQLYRFFEGSNVTLDIVNRRIVRCKCILDILYKYISLVDSHFIMYGAG